MLGFNSATGGNGDVKTDTWQSIEIAFWMDFGVRPWLDGNRFSFGVGMSWRNWRMTNRNQFVKADNGNVSVAPLPEDADPKFSRIKAYSFIFPLMYEYSRKNWGVSFGPVVNYTPRARILTRYRLDGEKHKVKYNGIHQNRLTVDVMASVITPWLDFYVKYNPCNILDAGYGPRFHSLSFGIMF